MDLDALTNLAHELGVTITYHDTGPKGYYHHPTRTISLRRSLKPVAKRCTLAHELGHAYYGHEATGNPWLDARSERAADQFAAELLISITEYQLAEELHGGHAPGIAHELGVTVHVVKVWQRIHRCLFHPAKRVPG